MGCALNRGNRVFIINNESHQQITRGASRISYFEGWKGDMLSEAGHFWSFQTFQRHFQRQLACLNTFFSWRPGDISTPSLGCAPNSLSNFTNDYHNPLKSVSTLSDFTICSILESTKKNQFLTEHKEKHDLLHSQQLIFLVFVFRNQQIHFVLYFDTCTVKPV